MKTKVLLLSSVVTAFAFSSFATDAWLSPRAQGNQIKISSAETPAVTVAYVEASAAALSPRAQASQSRVIKGAFNDSNPALECRQTMVASPKAVAECSSHTTMPGCVKLAAMQ